MTGICEKTETAQAALVNEIASCVAAYQDAAEMDGAHFTSPHDFSVFLVERLRLQSAP